VPQRLNQPYEKRTRTGADVSALAVRLDRIAVELAKMAQRIRAEQERVSPPQTIETWELDRPTDGDWTS